MMLNIPFYKNDGDGSQCMQVAMKIVLKHFLNKDFALEELDKLTRRKANRWTSTVQIASVLQDLGLNVKYYSKEDLEPYLEGEPFIRKHFGKDAEKILSRIDVPVMVKATKKLLKYAIFEKKALSLKEIEQHLQQDHIPMVLIDYNKIIQKKDFYQGHFVVLTGFDDQYVYYHESGPNNPEANKKVKKELFKEACNANGTDNDCIIVYGKRHV
ncbi:hypothetical protein C4573_06045 [Candidatus Woesearchaeota archaeon]|nr:MAG: hypothetical protein C4573_06045 [Candidatus Woesearchaeota archaeon]